VRLREETISSFMIYPRRRKIGEYNKGSGGYSKLKHQTA
jgi:hypothetical protein